MIRDITIGQYYPAESAIHKMDARLKLMITFVFIVTLFLVNTFVGYVFVIACMGTCKQSFIRNYIDVKS